MSPTEDYRTIRFARIAGTGIEWCIDKVEEATTENIIDELKLLYDDVKSFRRTFDFDPVLASQKCGEQDCNNWIKDFQDDIGPFCKHTANGYVPVCRVCFGPLRGER